MVATAIPPAFMTANQQAAIIGLLAPRYNTRLPGLQFCHGVAGRYAAFPKEMVRPPRSVAEKTFADIRRWTEFPRGGHFAAMEQPEALAGDVLAFFRELR